MLVKVEVDAKISGDWGHGRNEDRFGKTTIAGLAHHQASLWYDAIS